MAERDRYLAAVVTRLGRVSRASDLSAVLEPAALLEARRLADVLRDDAADLQARYLLGWLYWHRFQAQPADVGQADLQSAVEMFVPCVLEKAGPPPEPLLPAIAEHIVQLLVSGAADAELPPVAVRLLQRVVATTPPDDPYLGTWRLYLGMALTFRFEEQGEPADLDAAIESLEAALTELAAGRPEHTWCLANLGSAFALRFRSGKAAADSIAAETCLGSALQAMPADAADRPVVVNTLGTTLMTRFDERGDDTDLDAAIDAFRTAREIVHTDRPAVRAQSLSNLGTALARRFEHADRTGDVDAAINCFREALEMLPAGHRDRASHLGNLANALEGRFRRRGDPADLDAAIRSARAALRLVSPTSRLRGSLLNCLGTSLLERFARTGTTADADEAVDVLRSAVDAAPSSSSRATSLSNLGTALLRRYEKTLALADLDSSVWALRAAVECTPPGRPSRPKLLDSLSAVLLRRFQRLGIRFDLDEALDVGRAAVEATPPDHPSRPVRLTGLGLVCTTLFSEGGSPADLDAAIDALWSALDGSPDDHPDKAMFLTNMGLVLQDRFALHGDSSDATEMVALLRDAVDRTPAGHPDRAARLAALGRALRSRFQALADPEDERAAAAACTEAAESALGRPSMRVTAAREAAALLSDSEPARAADLLETAVELLPRLVPHRLARTDQQVVLGEFWGVSADAAAAALSAGRPAVRALRLLEGGRAILLGQALRTRDDLTELRGRHPALADRFVELRSLLDLPGEERPSADGPPDHHADRVQIAREFSRTLERIRAQDGFASFATPPTADELLAQAEAGPIVTFNVSPGRSDAIILTASGVTSLALPDLALPDLLDRIGSFYLALDIANSKDRGPIDRIAAQRELVKILEWLWHAAAGPVLSALGYEHEPTGPWPRVWWAPGGLLGLLPIHAAGHHRDPPGRRRTVMDRVVSSHTATVDALRHARRRARTVSPAAHRSLIVAMPATPDLPEDSRLDHVETEVARLRGRLPEPVLLAEDGGAAPTRENLLTHLPGRAIVHFACHGRSDLSDPSRSHLLLRDHVTAPLNVAALSSVALDDARLAYLSACSTAVSGTNDLMDEAIHLASACQLAGFPHVVGTLWEINDRAALDIADAFYTALLTDSGDLETNRAAHALHRATRAVRDKFPATPSLWAGHLHVGA